MTLLAFPRYVAVNSAGTPYPNAKLYVYEMAAGDVVTSTPLTVYTTNALDVAHTNPVVANADGLFPAIFVDPAGPDLALTLKTSADVLLWTVPGIPANTFTVNQFNTILADIAPFARTDAEIAGNVTVSNYSYLPGHVIRYGIAPNKSGAASGNTTILKQLCSPEVSATGYVGPLYFDNTTGSDVYYFSDIVTFRRGIRIDLCGSTYRIDKSGSDPSAVNAGGIYAVADFALENGTLDMHWSNAPSGQGYALVLGSRNDVGTTYFPSHFDSLLSYRPGNIKIKNLTIKNNAVLGRCYLMLGGLQNVAFENVTLDGQSTGCGGGLYEFGWATSGATALRETSHCNNVSFKNMAAKGLRTSAEDYPIWMNGAGGFSVEGLKVKGGWGSVKASVGEAFFYRPWADEDEGLVKRGPYIAGVKHSGGAGTSIDLTGSQSSSGSYLDATITALGHPGDYDAMTDLIDAVVENCQIYDCAGYGILSSAGSLTVRNTVISACQRGIVTTEDTTLLNLEGVRTLNCTSYGMQIGNSVTNYGSAREKVGSIRNCVVAGNGTSGSVAGIVIANTRSMLIENNRFGYELAHDGSAESTQLHGVNAASTCSGVRVVGCHGGGVASGNMYALGSSGSDGRGCTIEKCSGVVTYSGLWGDGKTDLQVITYGASMTPNAQFNTDFRITATNNTAFTINAPTNMRYGQVITVTIRNTSGGALGTATWDAVYKMIAWVQPGNGFSASITFRYDGTNWVEIARGGVTVPN